MGQHATVHGKNSTAFNSNSGSWIPLSVDSVGKAGVTGPNCKYTVVTSDATGLNIATGPAILYGIVLIAAGTMAAVYNALTATGDVIIPSTTASVNFNGLGVICPIGITCDWTSGTWLVLWNVL